eukprot:CAMPEP_0201949036 /NCGR_PEP_ID=MMETSP0903-20130614/55768_1 /ASSEMBLY_ACC=CAM_ASM_000552 /TAXON_ID=420261 /ORGANISM="Thalassiosira antarctica, Strain CCMP982" /LENGTH=50 /DNA_ID=CAMNT_0048492233 /DNA_START=126 /DNA_END=278 /DNA_ORIENTATION=-
MLEMVMSVLKADRNCDAIGDKDFTGDTHMNSFVKIKLGPFILSGLAEERK